MVKKKKTEKPETGLVELTSDFKTLSKVKKELSPEQMDFIKSTIAPSLEPNEVALFLYRANIAKLDPLNGEMFAYASTKQGQRNLVMFAGRDGKRVAAERTGQVDYIEVEAIYVSEAGQLVEFWQEGKLVGAIATGKRKDKKREYEVSVKLDEYKQEKYIWKTKPETMIKKVAESQLLSMMFPNQLGGIYDADSENFIAQEEKAAPTLTDGSKPATAEQISTLKALTKKMEQDELPEVLKKKEIKLTKQEASDLLSELTKKK